MMNKSNKYRFLSLLSTYVFILIPFLIMAIVKIAQGKDDGLFMLPDWSIASSVIFGQLIVGLTAALAATSRGKNIEGVTLHITILVCFGLVINVVVYVLMLTMPNIILSILQGILFILASFAHFSYGAVINYLNDSERG